MNAWSDPRAAAARAILEEAGIDIDSAANGIWLPRTSRGGDVNEAFTDHGGVHTNAYFEELTRVLEQVGPEGAYEALEMFKTRLFLGERFY